MTITLPEISLNSNQKILLDKLGDLAITFKPKGLLKSFFESRKFSGLYVHGSVGSGKTMLLRAFFEKIECKKMLVHYQDFMRGIHAAVHAYGNLDRENIISRLAKDYASKTKLLCLDEFEIKDITDAMIIGRLFTALIKRKVFIVVTTNTAPENLYMDGLQRELFLPFIAMIRKEFDLCSLNSAHDYRMDRISSKRRLLYPLDDNTRQNMREIIAHMTDPEHIEPKVLEVFGRKLELKRTYKGVLITDFAEMCSQNLSYNDYIVICRNFKTVIMENVPVLSAENTDEAIRFINFIDSIYFHHNLLFISMYARPEELYVKGKREAEFKRTISRLHEINSDEYFDFYTSILSKPVH